MTEQAIFRAAHDLMIILASGSPRRSELLAGLGLGFLVRPAPCAEPEARAGENYRHYAMRAASAKAHCRAVLDMTDTYPAGIRRRLTIGADTVVTADGRLFGKPSNPQEALEILCFLSGKAHRVFTGVCLLLTEHGGRKSEIVFSEKTEVVFHKWPESALAAYASLEEPLDKAGAYAIQGKGSFLVKSVNGSISNVIGLPVAALAARLLRKGLIAPVAPA